jgi:hypothetical protein
MLGQTSRAIGVNGVTTGATNLRGSSLLKRDAMPMSKAPVVRRNTPIGGPRPQTVGRLGGTVMGRNNHSAIVDGTQLRRKF